MASSLPSQGTNQNPRTFKEIIDNGGKIDIPIRPSVILDKEIYQSVDYLLQQISPQLVAIITLLKVNHVDFFDITLANGEIINWKKI